SSSRSRSCSRWRSSARRRGPRTLSLVASTRRRYPESRALSPAMTRSSRCSASQALAARSRNCSCRVTENRKIVLAYSGGLDTSVAIRWLKDLGGDVIASPVALGEKKDLDAVQAKAPTPGASAAYVADGRRPFLELFV